MALSFETPVIPSDKRYAMTIGTGYYSGGSALSTSFAGRLNDSTTISAGAGVGLDTGKVGARGGVTFAW
ncbi:YadA-like family protein [Psychrobacter sp. Cmf 22.2]|uniref:YadA-like family protein n=3 Tax=Psychrobacter TaxID=497 RepID=UPI00117A7F70